MNDSAPFGGGIEICAIKIPEQIDPKTYQALMQQVSAEKRRRIERFIYPKDASRAMLGELLIRKMIRDKLRISPQDIRFTTNSYGKPYLQNHPSFEFNISHSGEWVVCAANSSPVGIDIEQVQLIDLEIARRFFASPEYGQLMQKPLSERQGFFYDLWTLKESYMKAVGKGLSIPLDSFSIELISRENIRLTTGGLEGKFQFRQYDVDPGYRLAVCSLHPQFPDRISTLHWMEVC